MNALLIITLMVATYIYGRVVGYFSGYLEGREDQKRESELKVLICPDLPVTTQEKSKAYTMVGEGTYRTFKTNEN